MGHNGETYVVVDIVVDMGLTVKPTNCNVYELHSIHVYTYIYIHRDRFIRVYIYMWIDHEKCNYITTRRICLNGFMTIGMTTAE
jgi:hypothetical protein